jgi:DNA-binding NarL/FixJ family response regulator
MLSGTNGESRIDLLVCDGGRMYAQLMAEALQCDRHLRVIAFAADEREFLELASRYTVDVVIVGATGTTDPLGGLKTLREFHAAYPSIPAVVLLDSCRREDVLEAFCSGARGIFGKGESIESLRKCVRVVYEGQVWANSRDLKFVLEALAGTASIRAVDASGMNLLTLREHEVAQHVAEGLTNREIASRMGLSHHTIKNYLLRIFDKLGVSNRVELLRRTICQPAGIENSSGEVAVRVEGTEDSPAAAGEGAGPRIRLAELSREGWDLPSEPRRGPH